MPSGLRDDVNGRDALPGDGDGAQDTVSQAPPARAPPVQTPRCASPASNAAHAAGPSAPSVRPDLFSVRAHPVSCGWTGCKTIKTFSSIKDFGLASHVVSGHITKLSPCRDVVCGWCGCGQRFPTTRLLAEHLVVAHCPIPTIPRQRQKFLDGIFRMDKRQRVGPLYNDAPAKPVVGQPRHSCEWKGCKFTTPVHPELACHAVTTHVSRRQLPEFSFTCDWAGCGGIYLNSRELADHLTTEHGKYYRMSICLCGTQVPKGTLPAHERACPVMKGNVPLTIPHPFSSVAYSGRSSTTNDSSPVSLLNRRLSDVQAGSYGNASQEAASASPSHPAQSPSSPEKRKRKIISYPIAHSDSSDSDSDRRTRRKTMLEIAEKKPNIPRKRIQRPSAVDGNTTGGENEKAVTAKPLDSTRTPEQQMEEEMKQQQQKEANRERREGKRVEGRDGVHDTTTREEGQQTKIEKPESAANNSIPRAELAGKHSQEVNMASMMEFDDTVPIRLHSTEGASVDYRRLSASSINEGTADIKQKDPVGHEVPPKSTQSNYEPDHAIDLQEHAQTDHDNDSRPSESELQAVAKLRELSTVLRSLASTIDTAVTQLPVGYLEGLAGELDNDWAIEDMNTMVRGVIAQYGLGGDDKWVRGPRWRKQPSTHKTPPFQSNEEANASPESLEEYAAAIRRYAPDNRRCFSAIQKIWGPIQENLPGGLPPSALLEMLGRPLLEFSGLVKEGSEARRRLEAAMRLRGKPADAYLEVEDVRKAIGSWWDEVGRSDR